jgi:hypothetical protein
LDVDVSRLSTDETGRLVDSLQWEISLQQRTSTVVTICFNILAALLVVASVLFDANKALKKRKAPRALCEAPIPDFEHH